MVFAVITDDPTHFIPSNTYVNPLLPVYKVPFTGFDGKFNAAMFVS
jgi:hypothetical protein